MSISLFAAGGGVDSPDMLERGGNLLFYLKPLLQSIFSFSLARLT